MSHFGDLFVFSAESGQPFTPDTDRYRIVKSCNHLALSLLESPAGQKSLVHVATAIIEERKAMKKTTYTAHIYQDSLNKMPYWIDRFLASMNANFQEVIIKEGLPGEAAAERHEWGRDMSDYNARLAGSLVLSGVLIDNMVEALQAHKYPAHRDSYETFKLQMGVFIAHEIVQFLTGFLTGTARPDTSPSNHFEIMEQ